MLFEHIEPVSDDETNDKIMELQEKIEELGEEINDLAEITTSETEKESSKQQEKLGKEIEEFESEIQELESELESENDDNYPMWNTLFEQKSEWDKVTQFAQNIGMGLINSNDYFKETLFMTSAGHSFYSAYWIPLYLCLFGDTIATKYKNVNYEGL
jgi:chromosome segregation ATPase